MHTRCPLGVRLGRADHLAGARMRGRCSPVSGPFRSGRIGAALGPGCVKTLRGITAPRILRLMVTLRAKKRKNSSFARHYDQIRFRFHTAWAISGHLASFACGAPARVVADPSWQASRAHPRPRIHGQVIATPLASSAMLSWPRCRSRPRCRPGGGLPGSCGCCGGSAASFARA
jgi:hypothetical protein